MPTKTPAACVSRRCPVKRKVGLPGPTGPKPVHKSIPTRIGTLTGGSSGTGDRRLDVDDLPDGGDLPRHLIALEGAV
jgi:hypothetical protein